MPDINTHIRISKLLKLALLTDKEGEALSALQALRRTLETAQLNVYDFSDYASAFKTTEPPWDIDPNETKPQQAPPRRTQTKPQQEKPKQQASSPVDWHIKVDFLIINTDSSLSDLEKKFIKSLGQWTRPLSDKQAAWLDAIYVRVRAKAKQNKR